MEGKSQSTHAQCQEVMGRGVSNECHWPFLDRLAHCECETVLIKFTTLQMKFCDLWEKGEGGRIEGCEQAVLSFHFSMSPVSVKECHTCQPLSRCQTDNNYYYMENYTGSSSARQIAPTFF